MKLKVRVHDEDESLVKIAEDAQSEVGVIEDEDVAIALSEEQDVAVNLCEEELATVNIQSEIVNVASDSYADLTNKPKINGNVLIGNKTSAELGIKDDVNFIFTQAMPSAEWVIVHNLDKYPSITVVDSGGSVVTGDYKYLDENTVKCIFSGEFSGKAYLN